MVSLGCRCRRLTTRCSTSSKAASNGLDVESAAVGIENTESPKRRAPQSIARQQERRTRRYRTGLLTLLIVFVRLPRTAVLYQNHADHGMATLALCAGRCYALHS